MPIRPLRFFALTYLLSWLIWIPLTLSHFGLGPFHIAEETSTIVRLLGVLMPAASALILTGIAGGRGALQTLLSRLTLWRVDWKYWLAATLVQPLLLLASAMTFNLFAPTDLSPAPIASASALIVKAATPPLKTQLNRSPALWRWNAPHKASSSMSCTHPSRARNPPPGLESLLK